MLCLQLADGAFIKRITYLLTYLLITYLMTCEMLTKASHYKRPDFKILLTVFDALLVAIIFTRACGSRWCQLRPFLSIF